MMYFSYLLYHCDSTDDTHRAVAMVTLWLAWFSEVAVNNLSLWPDVYKCIYAN